MLKKAEAVERGIEPFMGRIRKKPGPKRKRFVYPRNLIQALRWHKTLMASFDPNDRVGYCIKEKSQKALEKIQARVDSYEESEGLDVYRLMRCTCYSPFHMQAFGEGRYACGPGPRPHLREGKATEPEKWKWMCTVCGQQNHVGPTPGPEQISKIP